MMTPEFERGLAVGVGLAVLGMTLCALALAWVAWHNGRPRNGESAPGETPLDQRKPPQGGSGTAPARQYGKCPTPPTDTPLPTKPPQGAAPSVPAVPCPPEEPAAVAGKPPACDLSCSASWACARQQERLAEAEAKVEGLEAGAREAVAEVVRLEKRAEAAEAELERHKRLEVHRRNMLGAYARRMKAVRRAAIEYKAGQRFDGLASREEARAALLRASAAEGERDRLKASYSELESENARLQSLLHADPAVTHLEFTPEDGTTVRLRHWAVRHLAASFSDTLREEGGPNGAILELAGAGEDGRPDGSRLEVTIRRLGPGVKSPADVLREERAENERLRSSVQALLGVFQEPYHAADKPRGRHPEVFAEAEALAARRGAGPDGDAANHPPAAP